jgi:hypothetical protein
LQTDLLGGSCFRSCLFQKRNILEGQAEDSKDEEAKMQKKVEEVTKNPKPETVKGR